MILWYYNTIDSLLPLLVLKYTVSYLGGEKKKTKLQKLWRISFTWLFTFWLLIVAHLSCKISSSMKSSFNLLYHLSMAIKKTQYLCINLLFSNFMLFCCLLLLPSLETPTNEVLINYYLSLKPNYKMVCLI